jgi:mono/diheme cytochrome c family protein
MACRAAWIGGLVLLLAMGCGSSDDGGSAGTAIHPAQLFSGYDDGTTTFEVPAALVGTTSKTVKWSVVDGNLATVAPDPEDARHAIVTTKAAGKTTLKASVGGQTYSVPLTITQYPPGAQELGNELYQEDRSAPSDGTGEQQDVKGLGCIACHGTGGVNHSPSKIGGYDDASILKTIATGVKPDGGLANNGAHKFTLDPTQQQAILARLRSLTPTDWPQ